MSEAQDGDQVKASIDKLFTLFEKNDLLWGMRYIPHYFRKPSPPFHLKITQEADKNLYLAIQAPRGSAKSTMLTFLKPIHYICFKKRRFIIICQNTYKKAAASLESIKIEFRDNVLLKKDFPVEMRKDAEGDTIFRHSDGYEVRVLCKGADQIGSIRGEKFGAYRPDLIIVDDLEDDELVKSDDRRLDLENQFNEVIKYAGETGETRIVVIGTLLHDDSLMAKLVSRDKYKQYRKLFFRARNEVNGQKVSLWPEKWTVEYLDDLEKEDPIGFGKEMQGDPSKGSIETFRREDFRYWDVQEGKIVLFNKDNQVRARWNYTDCKAAISGDLAWEEKRESDSTVIFPALITPNSEILFEEYICRRGMRPNECEDILFDMAARLEKLTGKRVPIGFEKAKLEKVMKWFLGEAMRRRNKYLWLRDLQWDGDKLQRIMMRLSNRYAQHAIYHKRGMGDLENQLIRLRSTPHDDIADAAQGAVQMLEYAPRKTIAKVDMEDPGFEKLRSLVIKKRDKNRTPFIFGRKKQRFTEVPYIKTF